MSGGGLSYGDWQGQPVPWQGASGEREGERERGEGEAGNVAQQRWRDNSAGAGRRGRSAEMWEDAEGCRNF